jgi:hypothetical protein
MGPDVSGAMERLCMSNPLSTRLFVSLPLLWAVAFPREVPLFAQPVYMLSDPIVARMGQQLADNGAIV